MKFPQSNLLFLSFFLRMKEETKKSCLSMQNRTKWFISHPQYSISDCIWLFILIVHIRF